MYNYVQLCTNCVIIYTIMQIFLFKNLQVIDIKGFRKKLGINQKELSEMLSLSQSYVSRLEAEKNEITDDVIDRINKLATEKDIKVPHIQPDAVSDKYHLYVTKNSDQYKTIKVTDYNVYAHYRPGYEIDLKKNEGTLIYGRIYVLYLNGSPHPIICHIHQSDDPDCYDIQTSDTNIQKISKDEVEGVYNIVRYVERYL